jgi:hypothetical protein
VFRPEVLKDAERQV